MARQFRTLKNTYTSGEQDPSLALREDIKHYYNGADKLRNVIVRPQGGVDRRWGTRFLDYIWERLSSISGAYTYTAPNGGTANNARDDDGSTVLLTTTNISTTLPYVIVHVDAGTAVTVDAVLVRNLKMTTMNGAGPPSGVFVQYSTDDTNWTSYGPALLSISTDFISRKRSGDNRVAATARYWRLARVSGATDYGTAKFQISDFVLQQQNGSLSNVRMVPIDYDADNKMMMVLTSINAAIYKDDTSGSDPVWQTDMKSPYVSADLPAMTWAQSQDTVMVFHQGQQPERLIRQGADDQWGGADPVYDPAPVYQFVDTPQPGTITMDPSAVSGNGITMTASAAFFTSDMAVGWVIELPAYKGSGGGSFISTAFTDSTHLVGDVLEDFAAVVTAVPNATVREPAFTDDRGWPAGGCFHEGCQFLFNHPLAPNVIWRSRVNLPFNFDDSQTLDDYGFVYELTGDNPPRILAMLSGRHLQVFCHASEFYALPNDEPLTPTTVTVKHTTDSGSTRLGVRPVGVDGASLFIRKGGVEVDEFVFADTEQAYQADPVSLLSSHLFNDAQQIFVKPATNTQETNQVYVVNGDGTLATMATLRRQDVTAWSLLKTDGEFLQGESVGSRIYVAVERTIDGAATRFLEIADNDALTDCGVMGEITYETYTATAAQTDFNWTFTDPASASLVGVKVDGVTLTYAVDYTVTLGSNLVELTEPLAGGEIVTLHQLVGTLTAAHLPNTEVQIIVDGAVQTAQTTDASGVVTPDPLPYFTWEIGLKFPDVREDEDGNPTGFGDEVWVRDMPVAADLPDGTLKGEFMRIFELTAQVITTGDLYIGANGEAPQLIPLRQLDVDALDIVEPYTGVVRLEAIQGADRFGRAEFTQRSPAKLTLLGSAKKVAI
jgi:hypothetical protein